MAASASASASDWLKVRISAVPHCRFCDLVVTADRRHSVCSGGMSAKACQGAALSFCCARTSVKSTLWLSP